MEEQENARQHIVDELRRRKLLRSTTIYAICGWCLLQWSNYLFEQLGWPEWCVTLVLTVVVLGFPASVALAWVFDINPAGARAIDSGQLPRGVRTPISWVVDAAVLLLFSATMVMLFREGAGI
jgi:hypothetical protein